MLSLLYGPLLTSVHDYGKTTALTRQTFIGKVMSLLFNMLCRLVIAFLPRSNYLLISWLQSPSAVILEPLKIKSVTVSTFFPFIYYEVMGPDAIILVVFFVVVVLFYFNVESQTSFSSVQFICSIMTDSL